MIKKLRYVVLSLIAMFCGSLYAQTVTIDFDNDYAALFPTLAGTSSNDSHDGDFTENTTSTPVEGVTVTVSAKTSGNNENRIWNSAPRLRMYTGTFTVTGTDITKIEFTGHNSNFNLSTTTGTLDGKTWTGKANEIVFDVVRNTQINKIVVTLGEGGGNAGDNDDPELPAGGTETDPWSVAEALAACANLGSGENLNDGAEVYVAGVITKINEVSTSYGNATYFISDDVEASNSLEVYRGYSLNGDKFTSATEIEVGDSVIVCGKITNYNGTLEFATGSKLVSLKKGEGNGNTGDEPTEPGETGTIDNPLTPSQAYDIVSAMPAGQTSTADYYVKGKICSIKYTFSAQYGTATFNISDDGNASEKEFIAYSCLYFDNQKWQEGDTQINVGDEVIVCGKVVNYMGNTPEFASQNNYLVSLNGTTTAINGITTSAQSGQAYNMAGQKVSDNYRGLVVKNGKKVMMK